MSKQTLELLTSTFTIHSLAPDAQLPNTALSSEIYFIGKTSAELSLVCQSDIDIDALESEPGWRAFEVLGPLGFSLTGILSNISGVLASADVSIFAISTFDTDYILVKQHQLDTASQALKKAGYTVLC